MYYSLLLHEALRQNVKNGVTEGPDIMNGYPGAIIGLLHRILTLKWEVFASLI